MFCIKCGTEIATDAQFCGSCGVKVESDVAAVSSSTPVTETPQDANQEAFAKYWYPTVDQSKPKKADEIKPKKSRLVAIALWFLVGALLAVHKFYLNRPGHALLQIGLLWGGMVIIAQSDTRFGFLCVGLAGLLWLGDIFWIATSKEFDWR